MHSPNSSDESSERITHEAAHWCIRVHEADFSPKERARFEQWLASDPAHRLEFEAMQDIWTTSEAISIQPELRMGKPPVVPPRSHRQPSLRYYARAATFALLALPVAAFLGWKQGWVPNDYQRYSTVAASEEVTLGDGSTVVMNTNTRLTYLNYIDRRSVTLDEGEAFFKVHHDASHPFVVSAGSGEVTVTGTQFNVWKYDGQVVVTLTEGSVKVNGDNHSQGQEVRLTPGMQASYGGTLRKPLTRTVDTGQVMAWQEGKLIIDDLTLNQALPMINRYLDSPVVLGDKYAGELRLGGIYNTQDIAGLVQALPRVLPVQLARNKEGNTVIRYKRSYSPLEIR
ncbi:FecR family protein [Stutzerimonas kirkiae]|uniref:Peptide ABC transporter substrate-binding protein n=1 Tax=Stutzerimonas kirkiae TaxID=2211392 RepID=A0A4Q9RAS0_9GAMM|nr:FecR family protein [Stutzerimonas kirkiae]TBU97282.1 peptide ABC transporter substrate-binding protein [Stutzerimonas kirkiae]TBV03705.1 peptide ABC transporter substrate-binding protein [Stutzerimonas kirkiae]TBV11302.1 peptide ABC transporter substrate-binding protein [Stutzerimonas kirkiae]TBV13450.1 peptide ABC transporter substrate-binding protein [Stutzerimonas kirkiae]